MADGWRGLRRLRHVRHLFMVYSISMVQYNAKRQLGLGTILIRAKHTDICKFQFSQEWAEVEIDPRDIIPHIMKR